MVFIKSLLQVTAQAAPYLVIGYLVAAIIREYIPRDALIRYLGSRGLRPLVNAVGIGALLPICSCGSIPLGIGLHRSGGARGTVLAFMTSSPAISPVAIILCYRFLGLNFLVIYASVVVSGSLLMGLIGNRLFSEESSTVSEVVKSSCKVPPLQQNPVTRISKFCHALRWAFWDLGSEVSLDLLFGFALASLIITFLPQEWITTWIGKKTLETLLYMILISIPIYTCSVPSIFVVQSLMLLGTSPGAALVYLIAGPATNLGELNAIRHGMGIPTAGYYIISLVIIALIGGTLADKVVFQSYDYLSQVSPDRIIIQQCCVPIISVGRIQRSNFHQLLSSIPMWHYPFLVLLAITLGLGSYRKLCFLWMDPCQHCRFWNDVAGDAACARQCWVKRLQQKIENLRKKAQSP